MGDKMQPEYGVRKCVCVFHLYAVSCGAICFLDGHHIRPREVQWRAAVGLFLVYPGEKIRWGNAVI